MADEIMDIVNPNSLRVLYSLLFEVTNYNQKNIMESKNYGF